MYVLESLSTGVIISMDTTNETKLSSILIPHQFDL